MDRVPAMSEPGQQPCPLCVCYFGTYRDGYSRNQIMIEGLRRNGVTVIECHEALWRGVDDRVEIASGGWFRPKFLLRILRAYWRLLRCRRCLDASDVVMLGYPGQIDVYLARLLCWIRHKPLVMDVFMSLYLIASERGLTAKHPLTARLLFGLEKLACLLPDMLILDTPAYVRWFGEVYRIDPERFWLVPTGADERVFKPISVAQDGDGRFRVLYHGTFIPNHGVEHIVEAARLLQDHQDVRFELVGEGPDKGLAVSLVERYDLRNVRFTGWVDKDSLPGRIVQADVCLGVFGETRQSMMTIQNKIYEALAMAKPVITGDAPMVRQAFRHGEHLYLCERANPQALAVAVEALYADAALRQRLGRDGHAAFRQHYTVQAIGQRAKGHLLGLLGAQGRSGGAVE
jgi:glycosyltransferase involved in cell wall biosynthesis